MNRIHWKVAEEKTEENSIAERGHNAMHHLV